MSLERTYTSGAAIGKSTGTPARRKRAVWREHPHWPAIAHWAMAGSA